jgi:hypothetical protein
MHLGLKEEPCCESRSAANLAHYYSSGSFRSELLGWRKETKALKCKAWRLREGKVTSARDTRSTRTSTVLVETRTAMLLTIERVVTHQARRNAKALPSPIPAPSYHSLNASPPYYRNVTGHPVRLRRATAIATTSL